jgi:hypothetical protein
VSPLLRLAIDAERMPATKTEREVRRIIDLMNGVTTWGDTDAEPQPVLSE